jgi:hypothetical protein
MIHALLIVELLGVLVFMESVPDEMAVGMMGFEGTMLCVLSLEVLSVTVVAIRMLAFVAPLFVISVSISVLPSSVLFTIVTLVVVDFETGNSTVNSSMLVKIYVE